MSIDSKYLDKFRKSVEMGSIGASKFIGKNDKIAADQCAVDFMRKELNKIEMKGKIVIGEGEMDEAPMLYIGEELGNGTGQNLDIAVDPLEGTNFVAKNLPNSFSVIAITEKGNMFSAPDTYMEKIAIGKNLPSRLVDLDFPVEKNIQNLADAKNTVPNKLTACVLKRPRHEKIIKELEKMKVKIKFISDGDVSGAISVADDNSPIDIYMGIGGAPEGVLSAAALCCLGGQIQTRLVLENNQIDRAKKMGVEDIKKKYELNDMIKGDVIFCASAITKGDILEGVKVVDKKYYVSSLIMHKDNKIIKKTKNTYNM